ncbi:LmeA family phospholipid-binding protein [Actinomycetota bacterium]
MKRFALGFIVGALAVLLGAGVVFWAVSSPAGAPAAPAPSATSGGELRAQRLDVDAVLPYAEVAAQMGPETTLSSAGPDRIAVHRRVEVLGREVTVRAEGAVRAQDGLVVMEPDEVGVADADGLPLPPAVTRLVTVRLPLPPAVTRLVTVRQPVPGLPDGLTLTRVTADDTGIHAHLEGTDLPLPR